MRYITACLAVLILALALACTGTTAQEPPSVAFNSDPIMANEEPYEWGQWYQHLTQCTGLTASVEDLRRLRWYRVGAIFPMGYQVPTDGRPADRMILGTFDPPWGADGAPRIMIVWNRMYDERLIEHELFHYLLWLDDGNTDAAHEHEAWQRCDLF